MHFLGVPHWMNQPHFSANPEKQGTKQRIAKSANKGKADGPAFAERALAVRTTLHADDVAHLMASGPAPVQMISKRPLLWRRAKMPWFFGYAKRIENQHPSLCALGSAYVHHHLMTFGKHKT